MDPLQDKVFCDHCCDFVSKKTRYNHKRKDIQNSSVEAEPLSKYAKRKHRFEELDAHFEEKDTGTGDIITEDNYYVEEDVNKPETDDYQETTDEPAPTEEHEKKQVSPLDLVTWIIASLMSIQLSHNLSDSCISKLLLLFSQIFSVLSPFSSVCKLCANLIPKTLYSARKFLSIDCDNFKRYAVCPNCCALHDINSVVLDINGLKVPKKCDNHVYSCRAADRSRRKKGKVKCDTTLVEKVILKNGSVTYSPLKVYCFNSVIESLERILHRRDFIKKCNLWRDRNLPANLFADVYDGSIWKNFVNYENSDFLTKPYDFGCMINVDWYQPFSRRSDKSVGAIYLVFLNLPREERFKKENCVLVGLLPPLSKEPESLSSFLDPIVSELKALWNGVPICVPGMTDPATVRMALMCASADIPAARKLCGYLGHGAIQGCSHCCKPMWSKDGRDCGLPDKNKWPLRSREDHLKWGKHAQAAETLTKKKEIEKHHGYRTTPLLQLPYFNPSTMTAIDPMHNFFLGTAKKMFTYWVDQGILTKCDLAGISTRIQNFKIPAYIGRIPTNIASNYGQMTAKEWKNWVLIYSLACLNGILNTAHLRIWQTFVLGCRHFCEPVVNITSLEIGDRLMRKFCVEIIKQYGKEFVTPNMHLHCHVKESIQNFGSVYGFWLFSFERYNGLLADMPTNQKDLPVQLMRKFSLFSVNKMDVVAEPLQDNYQKLSEMSTRKTVSVSSVDLFLAATSDLPGIQPHVWSDLSLLKHSEKENFVNLSCDELCCLQSVYSKLYGESIPIETLSSVGQRVLSISWNNMPISKDSIVSATWADDNTRISTQSSLRPAKIRNFLIHNLITSTSSIKHVFASVEWYARSDNQFGYLNPVSVWSSKLQNDGPATLLPLQRVNAKCAWFEECHNVQRFIVMCPISRAAYL